MTILHANWLVAPELLNLYGMIFYFHAPIWEFAQERGNCSCKAGNAGAEAFFQSMRTVWPCSPPNSVEPFVMSYP